MFRNFCAVQAGATVAAVEIGALEGKKAKAVIHPTTRAKRKKKTTRSILCTDFLSGSIVIFLFAAWLL